MFQIISGTSKTVSGTQNLERNVPNTAHTNVPTNSVLVGTLFLLVFPVNSIINCIKDKFRLIRVVHLRQEKRKEIHPSLRRQKG